MADQSQFFPVALFSDNSLMAELTLTSPPGYGKIVLMQRDAHAGLGVKPDLGMQWTSGLNAVFLSAEEFQAALFHYPIAFTRDSASGRPIPVAILGLGDRGNVFVDESGEWRKGAYLPAYVRRYPFCLSRRADDKEGPLAVCVQEDTLDANAPALLDAEGNPTDAFKAQHELLRAMEDAQRRTRVFMAELDRLELLTTLDDVIVPRTSTQLRLQGLMRIDEEKLHALAPDALQGLALPGYLAAIYAHLSSLANFARLANTAAKS